MSPRRQVFHGTTIDSTWSEEACSCTACKYFCCEVENLGRACIWLSSGAARWIFLNSRTTTRVSLSCFRSISRRISVFLGSTLRHPYQILATFIPTPHSCELKYMSNRNRVKFVSQIYTPWIVAVARARDFSALRSPQNMLLKLTAVWSSEIENATWKKKTTIKLI